MTQKQCEAAIMKHLCSILDIYHKYNPDGDYLSMSIGAVGKEIVITVNNAYFDEDASHPLDGCRIISKKKAKKMPVRNIRCLEDRETGLNYITVDGVVKYEHLTDDEADEVLRQLLNE